VDNPPIRPSFLATAATDDDASEELHRAGPSITTAVKNKKSVAFKEATIYKPEHWIVQVGRNGVEYRLITFTLWNYSCEQTSSN